MLTAESLTALGLAMVVSVLPLGWYLHQAWRARRGLEAFERKACTPALWMALPAVVLPCVTSALLVLREIKFHEFLIWHHKWDRGGTFSWWGPLLQWLEISMLLIPIAFVVVLLSFAAYPAGYSEKYFRRGRGSARSAMFVLRLASSVACVVTWLATGASLIGARLF